VLQHYCITLRKRKRRIQRTIALGMQHCPTAAALSTSFLLNHASRKPQANCIQMSNVVYYHIAASGRIITGNTIMPLITKFRESYSSVSMSRESKRLKKSSSNWLNSGNALIGLQRGKNAIFVFPFCQIIQKHNLFELV